MIKNYQLWLPYFKQGDDLAGCRQNASSDAEAFSNHADLLRYTATLLDRASELAGQDKLTITDAGTHYIGVECEKELGDQLIKEDLLSSFDDEEDDWEEECDDPDCSCNDEDDLDEDEEDNSDKV